MENGELIERKNSDGKGKQWEKEGERNGWR